MVKRLNKEHIIGLVCIALAVAVLAISRSFPKASTGTSELTGPAFYPRVLAWAFMLCGLIELVAGFRKKVEGGWTPADLWAQVRKPGVLHVLTIAVLIFGYIMFMESLGFLVSTYLMLFLLMWRFEVPLIKNIIFSGLFVGVLYLLFGKLFTIYLPSGILDYIDF